jgi:hypothetical protein
LYGGAVTCGFHGVLKHAFQPTPAIQFPFTHVVDGTNGFKLTSCVSEITAWHLALGTWRLVLNTAMVLRASSAGPRSRIADVQEHSKRAGDPVPQYSFDLLAVLELNQDHSADTLTLFSSLKHRRGVCMVNMLFKLSRDTLFAALCLAWHFALPSLCCYKRLVYHGAIPLIYIDDCTSNYDLGLLVGSTFSTTIKGRMRDSLAFHQVQVSAATLSPLE